MARTPVIPETITVHLGKPKDKAPNVTVPFTDYIKNVASSEIYPTWPESSLRANIYAIISYALNRVYTEWYPSQGYDFDITSTTAFDQAYVKDRDIFENVSEIVDELFNDYIAKGSGIEPYISKFCNGTTSKCDGLSQWGTVDLAKQGLTPLQILQRYYGKDVRIVENAPVKNIPDSYQGPLREGMASNEVKLIQTQLNRIGKNYPLIPNIPFPDGTFGAATTEAVKVFQKTFNLTPDGIVGKSTWYKIKNIYNGVKKLGELSSEGLNISEITPAFADVLKEGMSGKEVSALQYYLAAYALFNESVPLIEVDGIFGPKTKEAVIAFQQTNGLNPDGIVGKNTWNKLYNAYKQIIANENLDRFLVPLYPGYVLKVGDKSEYVKIIQMYLNTLSKTYPSIPAVTVDGSFGDQTRRAVIAFQKLFNITPPDGNVGPVTWGTIGREYLAVSDGQGKTEGQFPGIVLKSQEVR